MKNNEQKGINELRPISAMITRPVSAAAKYSGGLKPAKKTSHNDFPPVQVVLNSNQNNEIPKIRPMTSTTKKDKESLYEENMQLKNYINTIKKDFAFSKSDNRKLELELDKKEKIIEDIVDSGNLQGDKINKAKETHLIIGLKKQFKDVQTQLKNKTVELDNIKKTLKVTKLNELNIEVNTYTDELQKLKSFYEIALQQNAINENNINELLKMQDSYNKQQMAMLNLQDNNNKLLEGLRSKDEELIKLKANVNEKQQLVNKTKLELRKFQQLSDRLSQNGKENAELATLKVQNEKRISDLSKDLAFYKDSAEKRDRRIKELEKAVKSNKIGVNDDDVSRSGFNNMKSLNQNFIQENPEEKQNSMNLLLKSKLQEVSSQKEKLELQNKQFQEIIKNLELQLQQGGGYKGTTNTKITKETKDKSELPKENSQTNVNEVNQVGVGESQGDLMNSSMINEDQLNEFTYTLIKNFEALRIDSSIIEMRVFSEVKSTTPEEIAKEISGKIVEVLKVKNQEDMNKIVSYITTLFLINGGDLENFKVKFLSLFESITYYNVDQGKLYSQKIKKKLLPNQDYLTKAIQFYDKNNTGFISFFNLRNIFETINLRLKDIYVEYLIYVMKNFSDDNATLEDLKYENIFKLMNDAEDDKDKDDSSELEEDDLKVNSEQMGGEGDDESEVVISQDTFEKKTEVILGKMAEFFFYKNNKNNQKKTVDQIVRTHYGSAVTKHEVSDTESYEAIPLGHFVKDLADKMEVKVDTLDIYCIFTKLKYSENFETIDLNRIITEMKQYSTDDGALDLNISPEKKRDKSEHEKPTKESPKKDEEGKDKVNNSSNIKLAHVKHLNQEHTEEDDDLFVNLNKFLKEKGMLFDDLLDEFDKLIKVENNIKLMTYSDFISLMCASEILPSPYLSAKTLSLISESAEYINLSNLKNTINKMKTARPMSGIGTRNATNSKKPQSKEKEEHIKQISNINEDDLDQVNISKDVPNSSRIFNESGDKENLKLKDMTKLKKIERPPSAKMKKTNVSNNNKSTDRYDEKDTNAKKVEEKIIKVDEDDDDLNYDFANDKDLNDSDSIKNLEREILKENMEIAEKRELEREKLTTENNKAKTEEDEDNYNVEDFEDSRDIKK